MSKIVTFVHKGSFTNTERFLNTVKGAGYLNKLDDYGRQGADALASATPVDSGKTSASWDYEIEKDSTKTTLRWTNSNVNRGVNIALILQTGHGTGTGGYVPGRDYINPALAPIMDSTSEAVWTEVKRA